jgi:hypothetical protein
MEDALDFANVTIDEPPDFEQAVWDNRKVKQAEAFGADNWPQAARIFDALKRSAGIYCLDLHPRDVFFLR